MRTAPPRSVAGGACFVFRGGGLVLCGAVAFLFFLLSGGPLSVLFLRVVRAGLPDASRARRARRSLSSDSLEYWVENRCIPVDKLLITGQNQWKTC